MSNQPVNSKTFFQHQTQFLRLWKENQNNLDAIVICNGEDQQNKPKTTALNVWFFGYDFLQSFFAFTKKSIILIASDKKMKLMDQVKNDPQLNQFKFVFIIKDAKDNTQNFKRVQQIFSEDCGSKQINIGHLENEKQQGPLALDYDQFINSSNYNMVDCSKLFSQIWQIKDKEELDYMKKAGKLCVYFEKKLIVEIESIIDTEEKKTHVEISQKIQSLMELPKTKQAFQKQDIDIQFVDFNCVPLIQSGGSYNLAQDPQNLKQTDLTHNTIITNISVNYRYYNSTIARTLFIDPIQTQKDVYIATNNLHVEIIKQMVAGKKISDIYNFASQYALKHIPGIDPEKIPENFGFSVYNSNSLIIFQLKTGLEFCDNQIKINKENNSEIQKGQTFLVIVQFNDLMADDKNYAIQLIDTVIIQDTQTQTITNEVSRKYEDVSYCLEDDEEEEQQEVEEVEEEENNKKNQNEQNDDLYNLPKTRRQKQTREVQKLTNENQTSEQRRKEHQMDLKKRKNEELQERLNNDQFITNKKSTQTLNLDSLNCYKSEAEFPNDLKKNQIYLDNKKNCLLLPIYDKHLPIHISILKNFSKIDEVHTFSLRLNFSFPGGTQIQQSIQFPKNLNDEDICFVKELTFRSRNSNKINEIIKKIKEMQKKWKQFSVDRQNQEENIEQEKLQLIKGKRPVLKDLKVRPAITQKKVSGMLECHQNGFRYITQKQDIVDITFQNIKHAFFQPCDNEMIVCIHFNLVNSIMIGKKKTQDIQFYTEAGVLSEDLVDHRRRGYEDEDEENLEKEQRKKINKDFKNFINAFNDLVKFLNNIQLIFQHPSVLTFEKPFRNLGFYGSPLRSNAFLQPTINCLINVIDSPFFILALKEVELVCFERMMAGLRNFDMVFVLKNYDKPVIRIIAIPLEHSDSIKDWLDKMDILFFETTRNLQWSTVLGEIKKDIKGFIEEGGWNPVLEGSESEQDQEEEDNDSEFSLQVINFQKFTKHIKEDDDDEEDEDEDDEYSGEDEDDDDNIDGEEELSEKGKDWSEMSDEDNEEDDSRKNRRDQQNQPQKKVSKK